MLPEATTAPQARLSGATVTRCQVQDLLNLMRNEKFEPFLVGSDEEGLKVLRHEAQSATITMTE